MKIYTLEVCVEGDGDPSPADVALVIRNACTLGREKRYPGGDRWWITTMVAGPVREET